MQEVADSLLPAEGPAPTATEEGTVTPVKEKWTVRRVIDGRYLPTVIDNVRNNVRSRPLLLGVYALAACFIALILLLAVDVQDNKTWQCNFYGTPPSTAVVGTAMRDFSIILRDANHIGVEGETAYAIILPTSTLSVDATMNDRSAPIHVEDVACLPTILEPASGESDLARMLCSPHVYGLLRNNESRTNVRGVAVFSNFTVGFAAPGSYLLVVGIKGYAITAISTLAIVSPSDVRLESINETAWIGTRVSVTPRTSTASAAEGSMRITTAATWSSSDESANPPLFVCGALLSLSLQKAVGQSLQVLNPLRDTQSKLLHLSGNVLCLVAGWDVIQVNASSGGTVKQYRASFDFSDLRLRGSNTLDMYLGFASLGVIIPLTSNSTAQQAMFPGDQAGGFPAEVIMSVEPVSAVRRLAPTIPPGASLPTAVMEGQPVHLSFQVDSAEPGHTVFLYTRPSANNSLQPAMWRDTPATAPKRLLFAEAITNGVGIAQFTLAQFSVTGAVGFYDIFAVCDGIAAVWPSPWSSAMDSPSWTINVQTSVDPAATQFLVLSSSEVVRVPWANSPIVLIRDKNGQPIAGKAASILSLNSSVVGVSSQSRHSDSDGLIHFSAVEILFLASNTSQLTEFLVVCDSLKFQFQVLVSHQVSPRYFHGQCSYVEVQQRLPRSIFPDQFAWAGVPFLLPVVALDPFGQPAKELVELEVGAAFQEPPPGLLATVLTAMPDARNGSALFNLTIRLPVPRSVVMAIRCSSTSSASSSLSGISSSGSVNENLAAAVALGTTFAAVFSPRFSSVTTSTGANNEIVVNISAAHWDAVTADQPFSVTLAALWYPIYVVSRFTSSVMVIPTRFVSTSNSSIVAFSAAELNSPVGYFVLNAVVDGVRTGGQARYAFTASTPPNVTLMQSAFRNSPTVTAGTVLLPPSVSITYFNIPMFVRVMFLLYNNSWVEVNIAENPASVVFGLVVAGNDTSQLAEESLKLQSMGTSDSNGTVRFPSFTIVAVSPSVRSVLFAYCVVAPSVVCVNDTLTNVTEGLPGNYSISVPALNAAPGQIIPTFFIANPKIPYFPCFPVFNGHVRSPFLQVDTGLSDFAIRYAVLPSSTSLRFQLLMSTLSLSSDTPPTSVTPHSLGVICPGQEVPPIPLVVDSQVHSARVKGLDKNTPVGLQNFFLAQVVLLSSIGSPLPGIAVTVNVVSKNGATCLGSSCGMYTSDVQTAVSDETGTVSFNLMMTQGATGEYLLSFAANQDDLVSGKQFINQQALAVISDIGQSDSSASNFLLSSFPSDSSIRVVIDLVLSIDGGRMTSSEQLSQSTPVLTQQIASPLVTALFTILNPVAKAVILVQPQLGPFQLQFQLNSIVAAAQAVPNIFAIDDPSLCLKVQFLDASSQPVGGMGVTVDVFQAGHFGSLSATSLVIVHNISHLSSAHDGTVAICDFTISALIPGTFVMYISSNGGGGNFTSMAFDITQSATLSATDLMKIFAALFTVFFSPMLFSTVPYSRRLYLVVAVVCGLVTIVGASNGLWHMLPNHSAFYLVYFSFICICAGLVTAGALCVALLDRLGYHYNVYWCRVVNDEAKALLTFRYSHWLVNITPEKQLAEQMALEEAAEADGLQKELKVMLHHGLDHAKSSSIVTTIQRAKKRLSDSGILHFGDSVSKNSQIRAGHVQERRFYYNRSDLDPVYLPINFLIVVAISLVLIVLLNCILYSYAFPYLKSKISILVSYFPTIDKGSEAEVEAVVMQFFVQMTTAIATQFPQYSSITSIIKPLSDLNVVQILTNISQLADSLLNNVEIAFIAGGCVAFTSYAVTIVMMVISIPQMTREIRRGTREAASSIAATESYTGQHSVQLILYYILVFSIVSLLVFVLLFDAIRTFLINSLSVVIIGSAISWIIKQFMQVIVVDRFLAQGSLIVRPELYSIWHLVGLFLGVFSALIASITRWVMSVGFTTLLFARLDYAIFPPAFCFMDVTHNGFLAMVTANAKNSNPICMMFATILLTDQELRRRSLQCPAEDVKILVDDSLFVDKPLMAPSVKNIARIYLRFLSGNPLPLTQQPVVENLALASYRDKRRSAKVRVANRFWLWLLLMRNPQLRVLRKVPVEAASPSFERSANIDGR